MPASRSVIVNFQRSDNLSTRQRQFFYALTSKLEGLGLKISPELAVVNRAADQFAQIQTSHGVIVILLAQWQGYRINRQQNRKWILPSEFSHVYASMTVAADRPLLVLREKSVDERGIFKKNLIDSVIDIPNSLDPKWLDSRDFQRYFTPWLNRVRSYQDIFLGYSSKKESKSVAKKIKTFLSQSLDLAVYDWDDFVAGEAIWDRIEKAAQSTACGIFLFTADDELVGDRQQSAPRDNVVYEAGYFAGAKGRRHSLVIREEDVKMPTDLEGIITLNLPKSHSIDSIADQLKRWVKSTLAM